MNTSDTLIRIQARVESASKGGTIESDTPIMPIAVADRVVGDWLIWLEGYDQKISKVARTKSDAMANYLADKAESIYKVNKRFAKQMQGKGNSGRDLLESFMFHWLTSQMLKSFPSLKLNKIPRGITGLSPYL